MVNGVPREIRRPKPEGTSKEGFLFPMVSPGGTTFIIHTSGHLVYIILSSILFTSGHLMYFILASILNNSGYLA